MSKRTQFVPDLTHIRTGLEVAGLVALALALWEAHKQRRMVKRLIDAQIARGDRAMRAVRHG